MRNHPFDHEVARASALEVLRVLAIGAMAMPKVRASRQLRAEEVKVLRFALLAGLLGQADSARKTQAVALQPLQVLTLPMPWIVLEKEL